MPCLDYYHRTSERLEIACVLQHERHLSAISWAVGVVHVKIDLIILALGGDVFAVLAHEKIVQLKILADNGFANGHAWIS